MNIVRIAIELIRYYDVTRQVGHTMAMLDGAKNTKGVIVVAHTMNHATDLAKQCPSATPVGLDGSEKKLKGRREPLLLDNSAVIWVLDGLLKEIFSLRKTVRELQITEMIGVGE